MFLKFIFTEATPVHPKRNENALKGFVPISTGLRFPATSNLLEYSKIYVRSEHKITKSSSQIPSALKALTIIVQRHPARICRVRTEFNGIRKVHVSGFRQFSTRHRKFFKNILGFYGPIPGTYKNNFLESQSDFGKQWAVPYICKIGFCKK